MESQLLSSDVIRQLRDNVMPFRRLSLSQQNIFGERADQLANALKTNSSVQILDISDNRMEIEEVRYLTDMLRINTTIQHLNLSDNEIGDEGAQLLAEILTINTSIQFLDISCNSISDEGTQHLADSLRINRSLRYLGLSQNNKIGAEGVQLLAEALTMNTTLQELIISSIVAQPKGAQYLANTLRTNTTLQQLDLSDNIIGDEGTQYLAEALTLNTSLQNLNLCRNYITVSGIQRLAEALQVNTSLQLVKIARNQMENEGARHMAEALRVNTSLQQLDISDNSIGDGGAQSLVNALKINTSLKKLEILNNNINPALVRELKAAIESKPPSPPPPSQTNNHNRVRNRANDSDFKPSDPPIPPIDNSVGVQRAATLAVALKTNTSLQFLTISYNNIVDEEAQNLIDSLITDTSLRQLDISWNEKIGAEGTRRLADVLRLNSAIRRLSIQNHNIGEGGARHLADALRTNTTIEYLTISINNIGDKGTEFLADVLRSNTTLQHLVISSNNIGAEGTRKLADALRANATLQELHISRNSIGDEGARHLANALQANTTLQHLNISHNKIGDEGARHLADTLTINTSLQQLDISHNTIGEEGTGYLTDALRSNLSLTEIWADASLQQDVLPALQRNKSPSELAKHLFQVMSSNDRLRVDLVARQLHARPDLETLLKSTNAQGKTVYQEALRLGLDSISSLPKEPYYPDCIDSESEQIVAETCGAFYSFQNSSWTLLDETATTVNLVLVKNSSTNGFQVVSRTPQEVLFKFNLEKNTKYVIIKSQFHAWLDNSTTYGVLFETKQQSKSEEWAKAMEDSILELSTNNSAPKPSKKWGLPKLPIFPARKTPVDDMAQRLNTIKNCPSPSPPAPTLTPVPVPVPVPFPALAPSMIVVNGFVVLKVLGVGGFGKVHLVQRQSKGTAEGQKFAMKVIPCGNNPDKMNSILQEAMESVIRHSSIVAAEKCFIADVPTKLGSKNGNEKVERHACILMEYCERGDLKKEIYRMLDENQKCIEETAWKWLSQVCSALQVIHSARIIHRDLKPENILLSGDNPPNLKISDFGIVRRLISDEDLAMSRVGTLRYAAPDLATGKGYGTSVDMWGIGLVFFELLTREVPQKRTDPNANPYWKQVHENPSFLRSCHKSITDNGYSERLADFICNLMEENPLKRRTAAQVVDSINQSIRPPTLAPTPNPINTIDRYELLKELGAGGYGKVHLVREKSKTQQIQGREFAMKVIFCGNDNAKVNSSLSEAFAGTHSHPSIAHVERCFIADVPTKFGSRTGSNDIQKHACIVMEYCERGDLKREIRRLISEKQICVEETAWKWLGQACSALQLIHSNDVIHRDLKPENILLSGDNPPNIKITDFGISRRLVSDEDLAFSTVGTLRYAAPDLATGKGYEMQADMWGIGVVFFELLTRTLPSGRKEPNEIQYWKQVHENPTFLTSCRKSITDNGYSEQLADFICNLMNEDPLIRRSSKKVVEFITQKFPTLAPAPISAPSPIPSSLSTPHQDTSNSVIDFQELLLEPKEIGKGKSGKVFRAIWNGQGGGVTVAVKRFSASESSSSESRQEIESEIRTMFSMHHDNVIRIYGMSIDDERRLCIVEEFAQHGSLFHVLRNESIPLSWTTKWNLAKQATMGLNYLHHCKPVILHRDVKSLNFLVDDRGNIKISDFGLAKVRLESSNSNASDQVEGLVGSTRWCAPEILSSGSSGSTKADVYALGITMFEIVSRKLPYDNIRFDNEVSMKVQMNLIRPEIPPDCPAPFSKLIQKCWNLNPNLRPECEQILAEMNQIKHGLEKYRVLYEFVAEHPDQLTIRPGDIVDLIAKNSNGWHEGELNGKRGYFPFNFVEPIL